MTTTIKKINNEELVITDTSNRTILKKDLLNEKVELEHELNRINDLLKNFE